MLLADFNISITPTVTVNPPDTGTTVATFEVTLSPPDIESQITVDYTTADGTATSSGQNPDYIAQSGTITFPIASNTPQPIQVVVPANTTVQPDKTFFVDLSNAQIQGETSETVEIVNPQATGTIVNTHLGGQVQFSTSNYVAQPGATTAQITITRTGGDASAAGAVFLTTTSGTATPGVDYTPVTTTVTFGFDQMSATVNIPINQQPNSDVAKTIGLMLEEPFGGATVGSLSTSTLTLPATNPFPGGQVQFSTSNYQAQVGASTAQITITRSGGTAAAAGAVFTTTATGTAVPGVNFTPVTTNVTFGAGQTSAIVNIPINTQVITDTALTVGLLLEEPFGGAKLGGQITATLTLPANNPFPGGQVQFSTSNYSVNEAAGTAAITITRSGGTAAAAGAVFTTAGGTAVAGVNYTPVTTNVTFGAGQTSAIVNIPINTQAISGTNLTVGLLLEQPFGGAKLGSQSTAALTIVMVNPLIVTNTYDSGLGSLRGAITFADSPGAPANPLIRFAIVSQGPGPFTIAPVTALPALTRPMTVDATTQPGYVNQPVITLSGVRLPRNTTTPADGLDVEAGKTTILGLAVNAFPGTGIYIEGPGSDRVTEDVLGADRTGRVAVPNLADGLDIDASSGNTVIGNVISGNANVGVQVYGPAATKNVIQNNVIGTDATSNFAIPNAFDGIYLNEAPGNVVLGNVVSGNASVGIQVFGTSATKNVIQNNLVGTNLASNYAVPNVLDGIFINAAPGNSVVGNVISGNSSVGIQLLGSAATGNAITSNKIGTDVSGRTAVPNVFDGVFLNNAPNNVLATNVISGNGSVGVQLYGTGTSGNVFQGNVIGLSSLNTSLGNSYGVYLNGTPGNVSVTQNVIKGNRVSQVFRAVPVDTSTSTPKTPASISLKTARKS